ncbi:MAG TPA: P-II family nitrogen regulator [Methanoregulaceae archaeon]|nr:P-II family nitrogen regulator [Methanoregulaceae archaeon]
MMKIEAIIKPERFEFVKKALEEQKIFGMTVTDVKGRGDQKGIVLEYRGGKIEVDLIPKCKVEVVVKDADAEKITNLIMNAARTGKIGDGRIFVSPVAQSIRVRTGETEQ